MSYTNGLDKPDDYFNTKLYTGDGTTSHAITGVGFQPDWVWIKDRTASNRPRLFDIVRGVTESLDTTDNTAETTLSNGLTAFGTDGFTVGNHAGVNTNTNNYVSWNWLAGGTASSNTDGSITSSVSANTTAGFSIVRFSGTGSLGTVGHGLNAVPHAIFFKRLDTTGAWASYHKPLGATKYMRLDSTSAQITATDEFNDTEPTSTVFTVDTDGGVNASGTDNIIAYCFAEKKGYSKFGSYTGNGNADGTFVHLGFKPAWVMIKSSSVTGTSWNIWDNKRTPTNTMFSVLSANTSGAEYTDSTYRSIDFTSQGFKIRVSAADLNSSGGTYIYMAFAENPFTTSTGIPTTAR